MESTSKGKPKLVDVNGFYFLILQKQLQYFNYRLCSSVGGKGRISTRKSTKNLVSNIFPTHEWPWTQSKEKKVCRLLHQSHNLTRAKARAAKMEEILAVHMYKIWWIFFPDQYFYALYNKHNIFLEKDLWTLPWTKNVELLFHPILDNKINLTPKIYFYLTKPAAWCQEELGLVRFAHWT